MKIPEAFGQVLRKHRKAANLSQEQLALQCDLDRTYIGLLERAQRQPSISTLFSLCEVLNVSPHILIKEIEEITKPIQ
ncbi:helix-turn-helix domain-containing protein [Peribacillus sp. NPDC058002]|uniref:helix-turn-helix domain-containing protein n=1 Tax=Peribacillus sp. NPDC058002 TaxID=3346301 RepID=UPI0036D8B43B